MVNKNETEFSLNNMPESNLLWKGLGGNFDSLTQILNEFIDNSISDFIEYNQAEIKKIIIRIEEVAPEIYQIQIEDTGSGIKDLDAAFSIGNKSAQSSSLNEHGFGMKHALAAANPENDNWSITTRTVENKKLNIYHVIKSPFDLSSQKVIKHAGNEGWPGLQSTGTIVTFSISGALLKTITRGLPGGYSKLSTIVEVLAEDLGYTYGTHINNNSASISIRYKDRKMNNYENVDVAEIKPKYDDTISPGIGSTTIDLGNGNVDIDYEFLKATETDYKRYYKANMNTSGVEIRVNGRLLANNLFSEIWEIEKHNSFNYILIRLNVKSDIQNRLPDTTTNKAGFRQDDPKLISIYNWIKSKLTEPKPKSSLSSDEVDLFNQLKKLKLKTLGTYDDALKVEREMHAFTSVNEKIRIDLYQSFQNKTTIYEGKKDKTTPLDVYQLLMYWDGLVMDNIPVDEGILIACRHPESVKALINIKNESKDNKGNNYKLSLKTWQEEGIDYPN